MFVKIRKLAFAVATGAMAAGLLASAALAGPIADRQKSMKEQGGALKVIAEMLKGERAFDAAMVKSVGDDLVAHFEHDKVLFPAGSDKGDVETWAKPEVWSNKEEFIQRFDEGIALAGELAMITEVAALGPKLSQIGKEVCGACHEKYRLPKE